MLQRLRSRLAPTALAGVLVLVAACGDDGGPTNPGGTDEPPVPVRVEIRPGAALVPGVGQTMALSAVVFDADGFEVDTTVVWQSATPGVATVSADGLLTGTAIGSARVTASVGSVVSEPALVLVAAPAPGVVLVADSLIVSDPEPVDPTLPVEAGWEYRIRILGDGPPVGTRVLGTGARALAGEVTGASAQGAETELPVAFVPLSQLFDDLVINETIPLVELEEVPGAAPPRLRAPSPPALPAAEGEVEFDKGPFECKASGTVPDLDLPEPKLTITSQLALLLGYDNALTSLAVQGSVNADFEYKPLFKAEFTGKVSCEADVKTFTVPLNGPLSLFFGIQVPVGIGLELNGKLELAEVGFEVTSTASATATLGLVCPNGDGACTTLTEFETSDDFTFKPVVPDLEDQFKLELGGYGFVTVKPALGTALTESGQWEFLAAEGGLEQTFDIATSKRQAQDTAYASGFRLIAKGSVGAGSGLSDAVDQLRKWLGKNLVPELEPWEKADTLARSPGGTFTITPERVSPGDSTTLGEMAKFRVELDPVTYLGLESVEQVEFRWRKATEDGTDFTLENARPACQTVQGGSGKTVFECETDFLEEHAGTQTFHAFVHAKMFGFTLPIPLEIAEHAQDSVRVGGQIEGLGFPFPRDISYDGNAVFGVGKTADDYPFYLWRAGQALTELVNGEESGGEDSGGISADGRIVVGNLESDPQNVRGKAFKWVNGARSEVAGMNIATAISGDGTVVVGRQWKLPDGAQPGEEDWIIVTSTGQDLGRGFVHDSDSTGNVLVGWSRDAESGPQRATVWQNGSPVYLGDGSVVDVSPDGTWAVGIVNGMAVRYKSGEGMTQLWSGVALAVNRDGGIILGNDSGTPVVWTEWAGARPLVDVLELECAYNLQGWQIGGVSLLSADGSVVVGGGLNPAGELEAWRANLCEAVTTRPSTN